MNEQNNIRCFSRFYVAVGAILIKNFSFCRLARFVNKQAYDRARGDMRQSLIEGGVLPVDV